MDCSKSLGNEGCNGGDMDLAFKFAEATAMDTEKAYPYHAYDGKCNTTIQGVAKVTNYVDVTPNSPQALMTAVALGPVSVAIDASSDAFQDYDFGIMTDSFDCGTDLDHGVLVVGYGSTGGRWPTPYWILKNSWGSGWGESGYFRVYRDMKAGPGMCGLQMQASYAMY